MNKIIALAFVAVSAIALVYAGLIPDDDTETMKLKGTNLQAFSGFCIEVRQIIAEEVKRGMKPSCEKLESYQKQAKEIFEKTKADLKATDLEYKDVALKCVTAGRMLRAFEVCKTAAGARDQVAKAFSFLPGFKN